MLSVKAHFIQKFMSQHTHTDTHTGSIALLGPLKWKIRLVKQKPKTAAAAATVVMAVVILQHQLGFAFMLCCQNATIASPQSRPPQ